MSEKRKIFLEDPGMKIRWLQADVKTITALTEYEVKV